MKSNDKNLKIIPSQIIYQSKNTKFNGISASTDRGFYLHLHKFE